MVRQRRRSRTHHHQQVRRSDNSYLFHPGTHGNLYTGHTGGIRYECIYAVTSRKRGPRHYDTVFINTHPAVECMWGLILRPCRFSSRSRKKGGNIAMPQ
jgi:hypothetical protein